MRQVVIAVSGYAGAGKDTFAKLLLKGLPDAVVFKYAESLREAFAMALGRLGIEFPVWTEEPEQKKKVRPGLQALAEFARSIDEDVFVKASLKDVERSLNAPMDAWPTSQRIAMITDLRHLNELVLTKEAARRNGWEFYWVHIVKEGNPPASQTEANKMAELLLGHLPDAIYKAPPGDIVTLTTAASDFRRVFLLAHHQQE
jgi:hypothetical protein